MAVLGLTPERRSQRGVTLVEVLVSLGMLSILVFPLMGLFTMSLRTVHSGRAQMTAAFHAQAQVDTFILAPAGQRTALPRTTIDATYSFERQVRTHSSGLTEVVIIVYWRDRLLDRSLRVVSLVAPQ
ncbi:MAG: hypothetical protein DDT37_00537 [Firmicutes bacterium]|nr:hypothetical protein [candidate division NPL-UPA2 bacterium]